MPGILPMKVIKVGTSSQSRIAQACDRCRSKKIKCDGIRPCCSQCANVGFECKTSDKLSRRAFPRGYTESLEERVRSLEAEVRELKDLLDEKDEKIDMLSKMHSNRQPSHSSTSSPPSLESREESSPPKEDIFRVQASPLLIGSESSDSYFMGASSGRAFIDAFKRKIQESGKSCSAFNTEAFMNVQSIPSILPTTTLSRIECIPPRLFSDKCVQIFWQEWAPLFPILNKSGFLRLYEEYVADPEGMTDNHKLAQLHLVFGIAALSSDFPDEDQIVMSEYQWQTSLDAILMDNTLLTLQCLVLATIYSLLKGDYKRLQQYKGISIGLSHRLGLHQSQKRFSFGALTLETRKKVFWTLYTVDCFSAATVGLPALLNDEDIHCEYPADIDDEYVTEKGFLPTLPGESSKISNALALFRASRILSKVLERNYPAAASHDLSLQSLAMLETELNEWSDSLPTHLKLSFVQDKPSTDITGDRSALLSLAYYYIRTLIHRPAVGSSLGTKASSSVISLAESSKHIIQIVQLLEERSMSFSFCLNKNEVLTLCGLSLLYQGLDLKQEGKLMKDGQRLVCTVVKYLEKAKAPGAVDFRKLATSMTTVESLPNLYRRSTNDKMPVLPTAKSAPPLGINGKQPMHESSRYSTTPSSNEADLQQQKEKVPRAPLSNLAYKHSNLSLNSLGSVRSDSSLSHREYRSSVPQPQVSTPTSMHSRCGSKSSPSSMPNLDYLSLSSTPVLSQSQFPIAVRTSPSNSRNMPSHARDFPSDPTSASTTSSSSSSNSKLSSVTPAEWESLLSALDNGHSNIYDAVYGGPSLSLTSPLPQPSYQSLTNHSNTHSDLNLTDHSNSINTISNTSTSVYGDWPPEAWDMSAINMHDFDNHLGGPTAQSVLSFSEDSLSSGDDLDAYGLGNGGGNISGRQSLDDLFRNGAALLNGDGYLLDGLDGNFVGL